MKLQEDLEELRREMNDLSEDTGTEMDNIYLAIAELSTDCSTLNVPPISLSNVPGISELNVPSVSL